jgi:Xaa-Pro aminopeptidase
MVDMAGNYKPYMDDMSRTFVIEHAPDIAYKAHSISIEIHNEVKKQAKAGLLCSDIYSIAEDIVNSNGLQKYFMGTVQQAKFIGHGVGLEINEPPVITPRSNETLESGMAFALEPKFVLPNIGAVGIENTYIVHHDGIENITKFEEELIVLN